MTELGIATESRERVSDMLMKLLADEYVLYTKTRNYHWNVVGPHFYTLHAFLEKQYKQLSDDIDAVAERIRTLDYRAIGTLCEALEHTRLKEHPGQYPAAPQMIKNLLADHETVIRHLRTDIEACEEQHHDLGTHDFLVQLMSQHEKTAWMLRALVDGNGM